MAKRKVLSGGELFDRFWAAYPRHVAKRNAMKAWDQIDPEPTVDVLDAMLKAIEWQSQSHDWRKSGGQFIPHPATWLRGERWTDEPPSTRPVMMSGKTQGNLGVASRFVNRTKLP